MSTWPHLTSIFNLKMQISYNNSFSKEEMRRTQFQNQRKIKVNNKYIAVYQRSAIPKNPFYIFTLWQDEISQFLFCFISRHLDKTSSDSAALLTNSVRRGEEKSNSSQRCCTHIPSLFFFFIHYLRHDRNKIYRESQMVQNSELHIPGYTFWIIYPLQSLWSRLGVYCMSLSMTAIKQVWFSQLFFDARLVCPLISPLVSVCLCAHKKYNLTCNSFFRGTNDFFFQSL